MENNYKPDTTVVFYTYAAEEIGLVGSQEIARSYANQNIEVLGVMQIDMAMYAPRTTNTIQFIDDFTSPNLTNFSKDLVTTYLGMTVTSYTCGYGCSDHASWNSLGFPAMMPAEDEVDSSIQRIHTTQDINNGQMDADYAGKFAQLAVAFAISFGTENQ
jgi:leucyl aminopeptidase